MSKAQLDKNIKIRSLLIGIFFFLLFLGIVGKLYYIQIVEASTLRTMAEEKNWKQEETLRATRGTIMDRMDRPLAEDSIAFTIAVDPKRINELHIEKETAAGLAPILSMSSDPAEIAKLETKLMGLVTKKKADGSDFLQEVEIKNEGVKVDADKKLKIDDLVKQITDSLKASTGVKFNSIGIYDKKTTKRYYPNNSLASHILGYTDRDGVAKMGLEATLNDQLSGTPGKLVHEKDLKGVELPDSKVSLTPAINGKNVRLTIDQNIQYYTETALKAAMDKWHPKSMTAIAVDPKTMEILAMANAPDFNPNSYWTASGQDAFINRAISSQYEPGSTFKLVTLAGAIQEKIFDPNAYYQSGSISVPGASVHDHNVVGWGKITFMEGLLRSSNVAFVKLGFEGLGETRLTDYIQRFGFGQKTGIALSGEVPGTVQMKYQSDFARATYGQSITTTALQQVAAYAAIANGGKLMKPLIIKDILDPDTGKPIQSFAPEVVRQVVSEETARQTSLDLEQVVANQEIGTGRRAYINGYRVAGKTGTANIVPEGQSGYSPNTWLISFIGYAPVEDPKIVVAILADQPDLGGDYHLGGEVAAPAFKDIVSQSLNYMGVAPTGTASQNVKSEAVTTVPDLSGLSSADAKKKLENAGLKAELLGKGTNVVGQMPKAGTEILLSQKVYVATEASDSLEVPDLKGRSLRDALEVCSMAGITCKMSGEGFVNSQTLSETDGQRTLQLELKAADQLDKTPAAQSSGSNGGGKAPDTADKTAGGTDKAAKLTAGAKQTAAADPPAKTAGKEPAKQAPASAKGKP